MTKYDFESNFLNQLTFGPLTKNNWDKIISIVHIENIKSEKVAKNNGMKVLKTTEFKGLPVNVFGITRDEWMKLNR